MHKRTLGRKRATVMVVLFTVALLAAGVLIFTGCESEQQRKEKEFKAQWTKTMEDFQTRVTKDDQKAQTLVDKNDLPGVISLVKARISSVDETLGKLLALYPPPELRKLQGLTAYYLIAVEDRLQAQNNYYEALLAGSPTTDAQTLMNEAVSRSTIIARELSIELQKQGITLRAPSTPQKTPSSTPSSTPSTSPSK
jgi:hypothetical protein